MRKIGCFFTVTGILLLSASILLCFYNMWDTKRANETAATALEILVSNNSQISAREEDTETGTIPEREGTHNQNSAEQEMQTLGESGEEEAIPDYQLNPAMDMPVQEANGQQYIGVIDIEDISVSLPVLSDWDYQKLKLAPCRYSGSAYQTGFVIMAHNYAGHFGKLDTLSYGSRVTFTDVDGNIFEYKVADIEVLERTDVEEMKSDAWDLTLFTCTVGGSSRVTARCVKV
jgi:sortase A